MYVLKYWEVGSGKWRLQNIFPKNCIGNIKYVGLQLKNLLALKSIAKYYTSE